MEEGAGVVGRRPCSYILCPVRQFGKANIKPNTQDGPACLFGLQLGWGGGECVTILYILFSQRRIAGEVSSVEVS